MIQPGTYQPQTSQSVPVPPTKKSGCGCFAMGCAAVIGIIVMAIVVLVMVLRAQIYRFTDDKPLALPAVQVSDTDVAGVLGKVATFRAGMEGQGAISPLVLNDQEINAALMGIPDLKPLGERLRVRITGNQLRLTFSSEIPLPLLRGRYLSGEGAAEIGVSNKEIRLNLKSFTFRGQALPEALLAKFSEALTGQINQDPQVQPLFDKLESLEIKDGNLIVRGKR